MIAKSPTQNPKNHHTKASRKTAKKARKQNPIWEANIPPMAGRFPTLFQDHSRRALTQAIKRALYIGTLQPESTDLDLIDDDGDRWRAEVEPYDANVAYVMLEKTTA